MSLVGAAWFGCAVVAWVLLARGRAPTGLTRPEACIAVSDVLVGRLLIGGVHTVNRVLFGLRGELFWRTFAFYTVPVAVWIMSDLSPASGLSQTDLLTIAVLVAGHSWINCVVLRASLGLVLRCAGQSRGDRMVMGIGGLALLVGVVAVLMLAVGLVRHVLSVAVLPELLAWQRPTLQLIGDVGASLLARPAQAAPDAIVLMVPLGLLVVCLLVSGTVLACRWVAQWLLIRLGDLLGSAESRANLRVGIELAGVFGVGLITAGVTVMA